jgi:hypothetical protein
VAVVGRAFIVKDNDSNVYLSIVQPGCSEVDINIWDDTCTAVCEMLAVVGFSIGNATNLNSITTIKPYGGVSIDVLFIDAIDGRRVNEIN